MCLCGLSLSTPTIVTIAQKLDYLVSSVQCSVSSVLFSASACQASRLHNLGVWHLAVLDSITAVLNSIIEGSGFRV
jgi:hypothetical protein